MLKNFLPLALATLLTIFSSCQKAEFAAYANHNTIKPDNVSAPYCSGDSVLEGTRYITGGSYGIIAGSVTLDGKGNVYATGQFTGTGYNFDPDTGINMIPGPGGVFLDKVTINGKFEWAIQLYTYNGGLGIGPIQGAGMGYYTLPAIQIDASGNIYAMYSVVTDPSYGGSYTTIYLSKYDSSGSLLWSFTQSSGYGANAPQMHLDGAGNVNICSNYSAFSSEGAPGGLSPSPIPVGNGTITGTGAFILKLDNAGQFVSAATIKATLQLTAFDPDGNIFDAGAEKTSAKSYIRKYDAAGDSLWYKQIPYVTYISLTADANGNAILLSNFNEMDEFDALGNLKWSVTGLYYPRTLTTDAAGDVYVAGDFFQTWDFDPGPGTFYLTPGVQSLYVQKFDALGNFIWAKKRQLATGEEMASLTADASSYIYVLGMLDIEPSSNVKYYRQLYGTKISQCR